ncbi:YraN family protein [Imhoffiella purpurea]|uniref:UPF0102 protein D779_1221 n=1 Tax=Imhoffiella purpurea TaxID=1249627 RepID=W9V7S9_9GAMM|nr:YraN family protein [Imhoffiella purpurea]EXJ15479.1 Putative endonuclease [Imhoffiella purpurea]
MKAKHDTREIGTEAERLAESFLIARNLRPIARNHRCRYGEIDLVMRDGAVLVFVEVRFRRSDRYGSAAETVDRRKQKRLITAARHYLKINPSNSPCRFDVIAIDGHHRIHWIQHAFALDST